MDINNEDYSPWTYNPQLATLNLMEHETGHLRERAAFGRAIISLRRPQKISQEALANSAGIDRSYMGRIERGEQSVSFDKILDICEALHIRPVALFQGMDEEVGTDSN